MEKWLEQIQSGVDVSRVDLTCQSLIGIIKNSLGSWVSYLDPGGCMGEFETIYLGNCGIGKG